MRFFSITNSLLRISIQKGTNLYVSLFKIEAGLKNKNMFIYTHVYDT